MIWLMIMKIRHKKSRLEKLEFKSKKITFQIA